MAPVPVSHGAADGARSGPRAALYCRTAMARRDHATAAVAEQSAALRAYADAHGYTVVGEYHGIGQAGSTDRRPALDGLFADIRAGRVDVVLVVSLDRLALTRPVLGRILDRLDAAGVRLLSLAESYDSATPEGRGLLAALTEAKGIE